MASSTSKTVSDVPLSTDHRTMRRILFESFYCDRRSDTFMLHVCMTDYVNANALRSKASPCFKCSTGEEKRVHFAKKG
ncbi:MAG TPA: hypothetical protein DCQ06_05695 [Myxococcales bacterium]|nr:hypothetical protein [Myxococcales bacterium]HAN31073.1 hypothetical protein [Myxococcales bacterium]